MERELKEAFQRAANQYVFNDSVNIQSILAKKKKNRSKQLVMLLVPIMVCLFAFIILDIPQGIANLIKSENVEHTYSDYLIHNGYYYVPTENKVDKKELDHQVGEVTRIGSWTYLQEGDTQLYIPGTKYYSIIGVSESEKIAVEVIGGTKKNPEIVSYQVLERKKAIEKIDNDKVLGGKGDDKEVNMALVNVREHVPYLHEFNTKELKPSLVSLNNDGQHYSVLIHYSPGDYKGENSKFIFLLEYEKGFKHTQVSGDFSHDSNKILSSFQINGVKWTQYETNMNSYFKGEKDNVNFEVSSQNYSQNEVKEFLKTLSQTSN